MQGILFDQLQPENRLATPRRYHAFLRALEGAFIVHRNGKDSIVLNRKRDFENESSAEPLEIALCGECGQHYYVGRVRKNKLQEAIRDPSHTNFGVDYFLPMKDGDKWLCRRCGLLSKKEPNCNCGALVRVKKCETHRKNADQLRECEMCGYKRGSIGDPVQEIVHGSDGPNAVITTALHELLPENKRKVLAFADSRQEAAFFAWYAENSYEELRDRNFMLRAFKAEDIPAEGLSIDDLKNRLLTQWEQVGLFNQSDTKAHKNRKVLTSILQEAMTDKKRLSLTGVGLVRWFVKVPNDLSLPAIMQQPPWDFTEDEAHQLIVYLLIELLSRRALQLPENAGGLRWSDVSLWPQQACCIGPPGGIRNVFEWGGPNSAIVRHFLYRLLSSSGLSDEQKYTRSRQLMQEIWTALRRCTDDSILNRGIIGGTFRLNSNWLRVKLLKHNEIFECLTCAAVSTHNIRNVCPRNRCPGKLSRADRERLKGNHYRILYENIEFPPNLIAEEHTAQIDNDEARRRQEKFKEGSIHILSSSTTFEVGVDLGDLETVFLRNVPPEPFNYTQRVGRAGRRETPGLALTYCRRNPHDLYHYEDPVKRVINGTVHPPRLQMTNEKIILRHIVATALSAFFRQNPRRFETVEEFVEDWSSPSATTSFKKFCNNNEDLIDSLRNIVPKNIHLQVGLTDKTWIENIAGTKSRLANVESEVCADYIQMENLSNEYFAQRKFKLVSRIGYRINTITGEKTLQFLSRKAVIPKYGFPVDVVELETQSIDGKPTRISLQRDLSQAIAEYAPGGKVVAAKKEWESYGVKVIAGKAWRVRYYQYNNNDARQFEQWNEDDPSKSPRVRRKYLIPEFGFVTKLFQNPREPKGRLQRMYTTRPFFQGFGINSNPMSKTIFDVRVTKALLGTLVILCEGWNREGFYICRVCGAHTARPKRQHDSPSGSNCQGRLEHFSLGHELVTDVMCIQIPGLMQEWDAYSVAYAVMLGSAEILNIPHMDLNVTITSGDNPGESAIVLYDNVPGGAGLVAQLEEKSVLRKVLHAARERVSGNCGCDSSCYGCLRSYRNQFAHSHLDRTKAENFLNLNI